MVERKARNPHSEARIPMTKWVLREKRRAMKARPAETGARTRVLEKVYRIALAAAAVPVNCANRCWSLREECIDVSIAQSMYRGVPRTY